MRLELVALDGLIRRLPADARTTPAIVAALDCAVRTVLDLAGAVSCPRSDRRSATAGTPAPPDLAGVWEVLAGNLTSRSAAFRHAVRLAVVVPTLDVAFQHSGLAPSYWVPLSAAVVLRPDYHSTMTRGPARVGGAAVGVGIIGVLLAVAHPGPAATMALVALTGWGALTFIPSNYGLGVAFVTGVVLLLVGVGQPDTLAIAGYRLLDTVIGGTVALVAYLAWPTRSHGAARQALARPIAGLRRLIRAAHALRAELPGRTVLAGIDPSCSPSTGRAVSSRPGSSATGRSEGCPPAAIARPDARRRERSRAATCRDPARRARRRHRHRRTAARGRRPGRGGLTGSGRAGQAKSGTSGSRRSTSAAIRAVSCGG